MGKLGFCHVIICKLGKYSKSPSCSQQNMVHFKALVVGHGTGIYIRSGYRSISLICYFCIALNGQLLQKLVDNTNMIQITTNAEYGHWTRENWENTNEKLLMEYIFTTKQVTKDRGITKLHEEGHLSIKGKKENRPQYHHKKHENQWQKKTTVKWGNKGGNKATTK